MIDWIVVFSDGHPKEFYGYILRTLLDTKQLPWKGKISAVCHTPLGLGIWSRWIWSEHMGHSPFLLRHHLAQIYALSAPRDAN